MRQVQNKDDEAAAEADGAKRILPDGAETPTASAEDLFTRFGPDGFTRQDVRQALADTGDHAGRAAKKLDGRLQMSKHLKAEANWTISKTGTGLSKKDLSGLGEPEPQLVAAVMGAVVQEEKRKMKLSGFMMDGSGAAFSGKLGGGAL